MDIYIKTDKPLPVSKERFFSGIVAKDVTVPPESPKDRDTYIVGLGAAGTWAGQSGNLAMWWDGVWAFIVAEEGMRAAILGTEDRYEFDGLAWIPVADPDGTDYRD